MFLVVLGGGAGFFFLGGEKEEIGTEEEVAEVFEKVTPTESEPEEPVKREVASVKKTSKAPTPAKIVTPPPQVKEEIEEEKTAEVSKEYVLDPVVYPTLSGFLEVEGEMIKSLSLSYNEGGGSIVNISDTKIVNSIFMVEGKIWNLHGGGKSYSVRIGSGPHNNLTVIFTRKDLVSGGAKMEAPAPAAEEPPPPEEDNYAEADTPPEPEMEGDLPAEEPPMDQEEMMRMKMEKKLEEMGMGSGEE
jgi:hypothetical protein